jgi:hypothetical protein
MTVINVAESVCVMGNAIEAAKNAYFSKRKKINVSSLKRITVFVFLKQGPCQFIGWRIIYSRFLSTPRQYWVWRK